MLGGGVSHPSQLTTGLVIKSVTTSPTLAGEPRAYAFYSAGKYSVGTNYNFISIAYCCTTILSTGTFGPL